MRWIVAQEGTRQTYAVPLAFHRLGVLRLFYTDIWCRRGRSLLRRGPKGAQALAGRFKSELPGDQVISFSPRAIAARTFQHFQRRHASPAGLGNEYCRFGRWFAQQVCGHLQRIETDPARDLFFGFDTNSLEILELLKERGVFTVLDQVDPGSVHEELVIEETQRWPGWQKVPGRMPQSYQDRRRAEWDVASLVLVNSEWSRRALLQQGVSEEKIIVVPLAIDLDCHHLPPPIEARGNLKVLWLGNVTIGKGIQYLVEAARLLQRDNIEFLLAGPLYISDEAVRSFPPNMKVLGWVTRNKLGEVYSQAHVFVLPTISDGFAVTQLEAMAHGLPVVVTPNCGRVVTHGVDGLVVPARDSKALADGLARLNAERQLLREMSGNALKTILAYDLPSNGGLICQEVARFRGRAAQTG
jgi:hypothetical protein